MSEPVVWVTLLAWRESVGYILWREPPHKGASIVDPHGDHLADARAKLRALAQFAERLSDRFVRSAVLAFDGGKVTALYESEDSRPYP